MKSLSEQLSIPKNTIKAYIYKLNEELYLHFGLYKYIQISNQGILSIKNTYKKDSLRYFNQLKLKYLKQSHEFNIMVNLATHSTMTQQKLTEILNLSSSYISRLIKKCNRTVQPFGFQITKKTDILYLEGSELSIRLYLFLFLSDSFQAIEWPFKEVTSEDSHLIPVKFKQSNQTTSHTKKNRIHMLFTILQDRLNKNQILTTPRKDINNVLQSVRKNFDIVTNSNINLFDTDDLKNREVEELYFNFFIRIYIPDMIPLEKNIQLGEAFATSKFEIAIFAQELTKRIEEKFELSLSDTDYYLFIYYLTILYTFYQIFGDSCSFFMKFQFQFHPNKTKKNENQEILESMFHEFCSTFSTALSLPSPGDFVESYFCQTIYQLVNMSLNPTVKIYIQLTQDFTAELFVVKKLETFFNSSYLSITDDFSKADLLITDIAELSKETIPIFYLNSSVDLKEWNNLLLLIKNIFLKKFFLE